MDWSPTWLVCKDIVTIKISGIVRDIAYSTEPELRKIHLLFSQIPRIVQTVDRLDHDVDLKSDRDVQWYS